MTITEVMPEVLADLEAEGFEIRTEPWSEWTQMERNVAETSACPVCDLTERRYCGALLEDAEGRRISYRCFAVCSVCGHADEF